MAARTIAEKILAEKSGQEAEVGEIVEAEVDYVMANDITAYPAFGEFEKLGAPPLRDRIVLIPDHYMPAKDVASAKQNLAMRDFVRRHDLPHYFEVGRTGVCHQIMIEQGFVAPGRLIAGADSHSTSYGGLGAMGVGIGSTEAAAVFARGKLWFKVPSSMKIEVTGQASRWVMGKDIVLQMIGDIGVDGARYMSVEFHGDGVQRLPLSDRITLANMTTEAGAKAGIVPPARDVDEYLRGRVRGSYTAVHPDPEASYEKTLHYDAAELEPLVAKPYLPSNVVPVSELGGVEIDQAYIGSCTNGRIEDLRIAAEILNGRKVHERVRFIVVPSSKEVMEQALAEGLVERFMAANAYFSGPSCGACIGGYMGVLAPGEVCISSTNRNFLGRMGDRDAKVYLANPAVVAASAVTGRITDPSTLA